MCPETPKAATLPRMPPGQCETADEFPAPTVIGCDRDTSHTSCQTPVGMPQPDLSEHSRRQTGPSNLAHPREAAQAVSPWCISGQVGVGIVRTSGRTGEQRGDRPELQHAAGTECTHHAEPATCTVFPSRVHEFRSWPRGPSCRSFRCLPVPRSLPPGHHNAIPRSGYKMTTCRPEPPDVCSQCRVVPNRGT